MSGLFLTMVCLILSALVLTMGPLTVESTRIGGPGREFQVQKRSCSREDGQAALAQCGRNERCRARVDIVIARTCGAKKRSFEAEPGQSQESAVVDARGQSHPLNALRRIRFSKRMEWR
ncbi:uncharacterized protein LOC110982952 [Acanthaster planci]|uniref:Uncharacterized protein LOC110982952 n=1 Tax=Acanthaster planci TaxID=133434 RepID=A0A8B7YVX2_ACAPL|nr:uncharacterized protein LOC110982952 [Acanthaster planci]